MIFNSRSAHFSEATTPGSRNLTTIEVVGLSTAIHGYNPQPDFVCILCSSTSPFVVLVQVAFCQHHLQSFEQKILPHTDAREKRCGI